IQAEQAARGALVLAWQALLGKDPGTPACHGVLLPTNGTNVHIGGFPLAPTLRTLVGLQKPLLTTTRDVRIILGLATALAGVDYLARSANALRSDLCIYTGHPVDVVTGSLVFTAVDLDLPGSPALRLERRYSSTWSDRPSPLGRGWSHSLDEAVWLEHGQLLYRADDGRELTLPIPPTDEPVFVPLHRLTVRRLADGHWQIADPHGITRHFAPLAHHPTPARLVSRTDRQGRALHLHHDEQARLVSARADDGREIHLHHDGDRLTRVDLPDPDPASTRFLPHVHYVHEHDLLTEIHDALGQVTRYRHDHHRITEETLPGGLRFHFAYDGPGSQAACVRTWGDGGILDHRLIFDRPRRTTLVINACNETTTYRAGERNLVIEIVDPLGHVTRHHHDELLRLRERIDPLGHVTRLHYDERGNLTRHEAPDGALTLTTYHPTLDLPLERIDPAGGVTRWTYDPLGRLLRHTDPLGRCTVHHHTNLSPETPTTVLPPDDRSTHHHPNLSPGPPTTIHHPNLSPGTSTTILHPDGRSEHHHHDRAGRLVHLRRADGSTLTHQHDRRGQLVRTTDDRGRSETRDHDLLGRLTRHLLPDGELRLHTHDPRGRPLRVSDPRGELHCSYTGLGWLTTCGSASAAPITLERDLEGRVSRVAGPTGTLLRIERDPAGRVRSTVDALGHARRYTRDPLGRVLAIRRPDGRHTRYTRDPAGRIVSVDHGDGTLDRFTYRLDGPLQIATRQHPDRTTTTTRRELDALGRIIREHQDEHHLTTEYDLQGRITRLRSSLGADLRFIHDDRGLARLELPRPTHLEAHPGLPRPPDPDLPWSIHIERDRDGHEQARHLPGDLLSWWHRDPHGRPLEHGLVASRPPQIYRHRRYHWRGPHLHIDETTRRRRAPHLSDPPGQTWHYTFTAAGELGTATTPAGATLHYRHDALGRRIARIRDGLPGPRTTRWLWHGDTLLHQWTHRHDVITWPHEPGRPAPLARLTATTRHAVITDHLGSPLALLDERGQLAWSAELDPRGLPRPVRGDPALCPFRHPGQLADPDTGLHHNRLRELDPDTGRYLSPDPLGLLGSLDLHAHLDDPATTTDILGLAPDLPHGVHARIAAELVADFPRHDLPPHLAELAQDPTQQTGQLASQPPDQQPGQPTDRRTGIATIYATPPRGPCD
ncbi:MAG: RHS repeat protein, partial [Myxococcales bacterium]|nr:RHS repeat protein [Myxococcales bacterium]